MVASYDNRDELQSINHKCYFYFLLTVGYNCCSVSQYFNTRVSGIDCQLNDFRTDTIWISDFSLLVIAPNLYWQPYSVTNIDINDHHRASAL